MRIEGHQTEENAEAVRQEIRNLLVVSLNQQHIMKKRLIWNSVLGLLNLSVLCGIVVLRVYGYL